jgi:hypothetical protein
MLPVTMSDERVGVRLRSGRGNWCLQRRDRICHGGAAVVMKATNERLPSRGSVSSERRMLRLEKGTSSANLRLRDVRWILRRGNS